MKRSVRSAVRRSVGLALGLVLAVGSLGGVGCDAKAPNEPGSGTNEKAPNEPGSGTNEPGSGPGGPGGANEPGSGAETGARGRLESGVALGVVPAGSSAEVVVTAAAGTASE